MSKIEWDKTGERYYESGVSHGVLYPQSGTTYPKGVAWNGLISVAMNPDGAEPNELWADNIKYAVLRSAENLGITIEAYTYPEEFAECDGSKELATGVRIGQQKRKSFGFCYRTEVGDDTPSDDEDYILHLIYGCTASPSEKSYETQNDNPDAITFSWDVDTLPVNVAGSQPTASVEIDTRVADKAKVKALEDILYGTDGADSAAGTEPRLPLPDEIKTLFTKAGG